MYVLGRKLLPLNTKPNAEKPKPKYMSDLKASKINAEWHLFSQIHSLLWVGRDPQRSWSPALKWMAHSRIKPTTLALLTYSLLPQIPQNLLSFLNIFLDFFMSWGQKGKFLVSVMGNRRGQNPEGNKAPSFEFTWPHPFPFDPHKEETEQGNHRVVLIVHSWYLQYLFLWRLSSQHWLSQSYFVNHNITNFLSCW